MTTPAATAPPPAHRRKDRYHHGDLREALIAATRQLVVERGAENFSLADACRIAGVSPAAPYKHFRDRDEILEIVVQQGFDELTDAIIAAIATAGRGTAAGMAAMGHAYLDFAATQTALFRLMFGQDRAINNAPTVVETGRGCFTHVIGEVEAYCAANQVSGDSQAIALEMWTFVHGAAMLSIDQDYEKVAPGLNVKALLDSVTPRLLQRAPGAPAPIATVCCPTST
jgi:AcrR family transcriptional regulator